MRQKATRQKSKRQKAIRRTYKKVIRGGDPSNIGIIWKNGIFEKKTLINKLTKKLMNILILF